MSRYFQPHIDRMAGYVPGEQPRDGGFIKLNTNENPYPPSPAGRRGDRAAPWTTGSGSIPTRSAPRSARPPRGCTGSSPRWSWRATARTTS